MNKVPNRSVRLHRVAQGLIEVDLVSVPATIPVTRQRLCTLQPRNDPQGPPAQRSRVLKP